MDRTAHLSQLLGIALPIVQAPMAGAQDEALAIEVALAGGLGSIPCALLGVDALRAQVAAFRSRAPHPVNLNFFCHALPPPNDALDARWRETLAPYYAELGVDPTTVPGGPARAPFDDALCAAVEELRPEIVSFHFGLPAAALLDRVRNAGAKVIASATTVEEARVLDTAGCDAIIAQGAEAGGHRGMFLTDDVGSQVGTMALVPQIVDAVRAPVIAAGGIADARGVAAAIALGASGVQVGTAYLHCVESRITELHRKALVGLRAESTRILNVLTGRPARGIANRLVRELGPLRRDVPPFPRAASAIAPLRVAAERRGLSDFSTQWAGQAAAIAVSTRAGELTRELARGLTIASPAARA